MKTVYYRLSDPTEHEAHQVYGRSEWMEVFGLADWSDRVAGLSAGRIREPLGEPLVDLTIVLPSPKIGDFVWTWGSECIVTDRVLSLFRQAGFTGFAARPVTVERIEYVSRKRTREMIIPPLWELLIKGKGGDAAPESGIRVIDQIEDSGELLYSSFHNGIVVDEANWDGADFFTVNGYPRYLLVTERVKQLIMKWRLTNCALIPSHKLEWESGIRPEEFREQNRAMASRDLGSLLADLERGDKSNLLDTIHALGEKGDPLAVDPLIRKFDHPDPLIWDSAACSVAEIARHKETPDEVRSETFSKLSNLLGHERPLVRKSAATALGHIGGKRAAQEVMRILEDPNDSVRSTGVFVLDYLRYKPALEAIRRLIRDPSKRVRNNARSALLSLSEPS